MNISAPFIMRPVATVLLAIAVVLAGALAFVKLPVAPLPQVDFPTISVRASLPGASPETMASSVATPLERALGSIAGITEMTSRSTQGSTSVTLQFDLSRDIDGAARDVQGAINAARTMLPSSLRSNPTYTKRNPTSAPIMVLALTSPTLDQGQLYDVGSTILAQRIAQIKGVSDVQVGGSSLPAVRVELNPTALNQYGIALDEVRTALNNANARGPKGVLENSETSWQVATNDQLRKAYEYRRLIVAYRNGSPVVLSDVARVEDSVEDLFNMGFLNNSPAILLVVGRQPAANIIETVDRIREALPQMRALLPGDVALTVAQDRTPSIRASLAEAEHTLIIAVILVILVVLLFLRNVRAAIIPSVAVPVSLIATFAVMYLCGYSLNTMSLMALIVATGFVVDDAIVVLENTSRHIESGMTRMKAALLGAKEVGFTVLSISVSLVAVFIPLLFMGGQVGRLFREFAVTLSAAVMISLVISLTTTPMMCAWMLKPGGEHDKNKPQGRFGRMAARSYDWVLKRYENSLDWALDSKGLVMLILVAVVGLNVYLFSAAPKGFFPQQDSGQLNGGLRADQSISSKAMAAKLREVVDIIRADEAVDTVVGFTGGSRAGGGFMFVNLKPASQRKDSGLAVIARLRPKLNAVAGLRVFLGTVQDVRSGGRSSNSTYQYTLKSDNLADLRTWASKLADEMKLQPVLTDIDTDQTENGVETMANVDKNTANRLGITSTAVDNALYNAFGQRQVATIYTELNQYHVVMEWAPRYTLSPNALSDVYVPATKTTVVAGQAVTTQVAAPTTTANSALSASKTAAGSTAASSSSTAVPVSANPALRNASSGNVLSNTATSLVPLSAVAKFYENSVATSVSHQDGELATTVSFNLVEGANLGDAREAIAKAEANIAMPTNVRGAFAGTAASAQQSQSQQAMLILAALVVIYIVLGILYESLVHPITVLSTLPSAGVGAVLALLMFRMEFSIIALIGVFLLIGIVKKNAILIIDFALEAERSRGLSPLEAVREACLLRFRPILMTTMAAALGALPLAIGFGEGAELRRPLGVAIIGGLIASQMLTLLTTPVVYLLLDKLRRRGANEHELSRATTA